MKMTKIESANIVFYEKGSCLKVTSCFGCFNEKWCENKGEFSYNKFCPDKLRLAEAYIKRHKQKCKKSIIPKYTADVQPDTTGSELKKIVIKPANPDPVPLEIAKIIRDNEYVCLYVWDCTRQCPISNSKTGQLDCSINRKQLIDSYIAEHDKPEPVCEHLVGDLCGNAFETCDKECPANSEMLKKPEPDNSVLQKIKKWYEEKKADFEESVQAGVLTDTIRIEYQTLRSIVKMIDHIEGNVKKPEPVIEPIKFDLPEIVYALKGHGIEWVKLDTCEMDTDGSVLHNGSHCYKTLDEAVSVARAKWSVK